MHFFLISLLSLAFAAQCAPLFNRQAQEAQLAPLYRRSSSNSTRYIVALKSDTVNPTNRLSWLSNVLGTTGLVSAKAVGEQEGGIVHHWDATIFNGIAGNFDDQSLDKLRSQSEVAFVEEGVCIPA